jgi:hypothetical protein
MRLPLTKLLGNLLDADIAHLKNNRFFALARRRHEVSAAVEQALVEDPAPSVSEVARRLNYSCGDPLYAADRQRCELLAVKHRVVIRMSLKATPRPPRKCERAQIERTLKDSLAQDYPVPIRKIAAGLGYANAGCVRLEFPELCRAIGQKIERQRAAETQRRRDILKAALEEGPPPNAEEMARRVGYRAATSLSENFPDLYQVFLASRKAGREEQRRRLRHELLSVLSEDPAPTLDDVCKRLSISKSWVYREHSDLAHAITARRLRQRVGSLE